MGILSLEMLRVFYNQFYGFSSKAADLSSETCCELSQNLHHKSHRISRSESSNGDGDVDVMDVWLVMRSLYYASFMIFGDFRMILSHLL